MFDPVKPRLINKWRTGGSGVHRFDFDGRYAYISPTADGFVGNIVMILDLKDPANPQEAGRGGCPARTPRRAKSIRGATGSSRAATIRCAWATGFMCPIGTTACFILDIADLTKPKLVSSVFPSPRIPHPTHTCLPVPKPLKGRSIMVVADEDVAKLRPAPPSFSWIYDITDETTAHADQQIKVAGLDNEGPPQPPMTGCHQPSEVFAGTVIPFAWFAQGLRLFDICRSVPAARDRLLQARSAAGLRAHPSNDVTIDQRGIIYLTDRQRGLDIVECRVS